MTNLINPWLQTNFAGKLCVENNICHDNIFKVCNWIIDLCTKKEADCKIAAIAIIHDLYMGIYPFTPPATISSARKHKFKNALYMMIRAPTALPIANFLYDFNP